MGDRGPEGGFALCALHVDMDPLVVFGRVGKAVDQILGYLPPARDPDLLPDEGSQAVDALDRTLREVVSLVLIGPPRPSVGARR